MSRQGRFIKKCLREGVSATLTLKSGTTCPCMISRDPNKSQYSESYHRDYPSPGTEDCNGLGIIAPITTTTVTVKGFIYPADVVGITALPERMREAIREKTDADMLWYGSANTADSAYYSLASMTERKDTFTYSSVVYVVRETYDLIIGGVIGQLALLKRKA